MFCLFSATFINDALYREPAPACLVWLPLPSSGEGWGEGPHTGSYVPGKLLLQLHQRFILKVVVDTEHCRRVDCLLAGGQTGNNGRT